MDRWTWGSVDYGHGTSGVSKLMVRGQVNRWTGNRWRGGQVDRWSGGQVDRWSGRQVDMWTVG